MSIITLTSAGGAPGVSTLARQLVVNNRRPTVLVDADPQGGTGQLTKLFGGFRRPNLGLIDLLLAARAGRLAQAYPEALMAWPPATATASGAARWLLPGPTSHAQARSTLELWPQLLSSWRRPSSDATHSCEPEPTSPKTSLPVSGAPRGRETDPSRAWPPGSGLGLPTATSADIIIDAGRLGSEFFPQDLIDQADLVILVAWPDLAGLIGANQWIKIWQERRLDRPELADWRLLLAEGGQGYSPSEITSSLGISLLRPGRERHDFEHPGQGSRLGESRRHWFTRRPIGIEWWPAIDAALDRPRSESLRHTVSSTPAASSPAAKESPHAS
ncbi:MAG: hypothetical protein LBV30_09810 [Propionibacteriaceae bacterium]|jgi:hypothetical protein|nr:hypothetical protein [Propionibacteriaceae bacterium]